MKRVHRQINAPLLAFAMLLTVGCSREAETPGGASDREIQIGSQIGVTTKAPVSNTTALTGVQFLRKDVTGANAPGDYTGVLPIAGDRRTDGSIYFATSRPRYAMNDDNAFFVAYWPAGTPDTDKTVWTIDGKTDILTSTGEYDAGNYSTPIKGDASGTEMVFDHRLAQLEVVCKADPTPGIALSTTTNLWGTIKSIEVVDVQPQAEYSYATRQTTFTGTPVAIALLQKDYETGFAAIAIPASTNAVVNAAAMLAPVASQAIKVRVTTEKQQPVTLTLTFGGGTFEAGKRHTVTLTFLSTGKIELGTPVIEAWNSGYNANTDEPTIPMPLAIIQYGNAPCAAMSGIPAPTTTSYNNRLPGTPFYPSASIVLTNEPPYARFEVAPADEKSAAGSTTMNWQEAIDACAAKAPQNQWRLPRYSEAQLMYQNGTALQNSSPVFTALPSANYWTASEYNATTGWAVNLSSGSANYYGKTSNTYSVRCVREVAVPAYDPVVLEVGYLPFNVMKGPFQYGSRTNTYTIPAGTDASYNDRLPGDPFCTDVTVAAAEPPYVKFEVAPADEKSAEGNTTMNWQEAIDACTKRSAGGSGWRLPRQSELMLMFLNRTALKGTPGFIGFVVNDYWSATEYDLTFSWQVTFPATNYDGSLRVSSKTSWYSVRCVREIKTK